jgi:hypothetical protein
MPLRFLHPLDPAFMLREFLGQHVPPHRLGTIEFHPSLAQPLVDTTPPPPQNSLSHLFFQENGIMRKWMAASLLLVAALGGCKKPGGTGTGTWTVDPHSGVYHPLNAAGKPLRIVVNVTPSDNAAEYFIVDASDSKKDALKFPLTETNSLGFHIPLRGTTSSPIRWDSAPDNLLIFNNSDKPLSLQYSITPATD